VRESACSPFPLQNTVLLGLSRKGVAGPLPCCFILLSSESFGPAAARSKAVHGSNPCRCLRGDSYWYPLFVCFGKLFHLRLLCEAEAYEMSLLISCQIDLLLCSFALLLFCVSVYTSRIKKTQVFTCCLSFSRRVGGPGRHVGALVLLAFLHHGRAVGRGGHLPLVLVGYVICIPH